MFLYLVVKQLTFLLRFNLTLLVGQVDKLKNQLILITGLRMADAFSTTDSSLTSALLVISLDLNSRCMTLA